MAKFRYKNVSNSRVFIPRVGAVEPGAFLETDLVVDSPFLETESLKAISKPKFKEKK